ncbi:nitroreductase [Paenibacillus sp. KQZ6P-2]|uniref:Putative NAD(P)H nitroreductase n=1 Tax=Paenibacillus mangrovi TaxID=2931978 RepID=A0A9X1WZB2_9BACL|nr:nitroreductase [Paenibacillus mangrovi]MCJ8014959.1 nitroreductase [Paenibacillus mangrovi]
MNISEAIRTRRSIGKVTQEDIPVAKIEQILEAGTWAPNHRMTEPWRFFVLRGEGRKVLGKALSDVARASASDPESPEAAAAAESAKMKPMRAPVIITVAVSPKEHEKVIELEEYGAVYAAIQNMLLEAHGLGLGAIWRTGEPAYHAKMNEHLGLGTNDKVLGFIYLGVPLEGQQLHVKRKPFQDLTVWIDEEGPVGKQKQE